MATARVETEVPSQILVFTLGENRFGVAIEEIDEIVKAGDVSPVPDTPRMVEGVMNLRGETTTIIDPTVVFSLDQTDTEPRVIIYDTHETAHGNRDESDTESADDGDDAHTDSGKVGWLVDEVHQVRDLDDPEVEPAPDSKYVNGILKQDDQFTLWVEPQLVNDRLGD